MDLLNTGLEHFGNSATSAVGVDMARRLLSDPSVSKQVGSFRQTVSVGGSRGSLLNSKAGTLIKGAGTVVGVGFVVYHANNTVDAIVGGNTSEVFHSGGQTAGDLMSLFVPITAPIFMGANIIDGQLQSHTRNMVRNELINGLNQRMDVLNSMAGTTANLMMEFSGGGCDPKLLE